MHIEDIQTDVGHGLLESLKSDGWRVVSRRSSLPGPASLDGECYTLRKGALVLLFEWNPWYEWKITGKQSALDKLAGHLSTASLSCA